MRRQWFITVLLLFTSSFLSLNIVSSQSQPGQSGQSGQSGMINSDPNYRALRDSKPDKSYTVSNLTLKRDVATIKLTSGRISFVPPVLGRIAIGVFVGEGEFTFDPYLMIERNRLKLVTGSETVSEPFSRIVLGFTDDTFQEIKNAIQQEGSSADGPILDTLRDLQNRLRNRNRGGSENL